MWVVRRSWSHGVMVSTLDFESSDPSSNLGETFFFSSALIFFLFVAIALHCCIKELIMIKVFLQVPMAPFRVDQLPMSDNVMGIWTSLVRLAGSNAVVGAVATDAPGIHTHPVSLTKKPILAAKGTFTDGLCTYT